MMPNYNFFVSIKGKRIATNLHKKQAIKLAVKKSKKKKLCGLDIGIGRRFIKKGTKMYTMIPYYFYI